MNLDWIDNLIRWLGGVLAYTTLGIVLYGIWRGTRRTPGQAAGKYTSWLRSLPFYLFATLLFIGAGLLLWHPLPLRLTSDMLTVALIAGALLYFPGLVLVLWGRLALGKMYFVSTSQAVQLFAGHELITSGPFAIVRHPMYLGLILSALGGLLIYQTWTMVAFSLLAPFVLRRARREERVLAATFGEQWQSYCRHVPALFPRLWRKHGHTNQ
jgi:protein-S-isoprenylcysteine O-methyltransferase Ste14